MSLAKPFHDKKYVVKVIRHDCTINYKEICNNYPCPACVNCKHMKIVITNEWNNR